MEFLKTRSGQLKVIALVISLSAFGTMSDIFDAFHDAVDKTSYGAVAAVLGLTLISIGASLLKLERKFSFWKTFEIQLHTVAGVTLLVGWGLYVWRVYDADEYFRDYGFSRTGLYKEWFTKAISVLVLEGLIIPIYFILPYLSTEVPSKQEQAYDHNMRSMPTTFQPNPTQQQQQPMYGYSGQPAQNQLPRFYNQQQGSTPNEGYYGNNQQYNNQQAPIHSTGGYHNNQQQYPNSVGNPRASQYH